MLKWMPEKVKKQLLQEVAANAGIVGEFVEGEARRRLLAISDPDWGAGYRGMIAKFLLTNEVEKLPGEVIIRVGTKVSKSGKGSRLHGWYIELGSSTAPAHPWLRPAVFGNAKKIASLLSGM